MHTHKTRRRGKRERGRKKGRKGEKERRRKGEERERNLVNIDKSSAIED